MKPATRETISAIREYTALTLLLSAIPVLVAGIVHTANHPYSPGILYGFIGALLACLFASVIAE